MVNRTSPGAEAASRKLPRSLSIEHDSVSPSSAVTDHADQALLTPNRYLEIGVCNPWIRPGHGFDGERKVADLLVRCAARCAVSYRCS